MIERDSKQIGSLTIFKLKVKILEGGKTLFSLLIKVWKGRHLVWVVRAGQEEWAVLVASPTVAALVDRAEVLEALWVGSWEEADQEEAVLVWAALEEWAVLVWGALEEWVVLVWAALEEWAVQVSFLAVGALDHLEAGDLTSKAGCRGRRALAVVVVLEGAALGVAVREVATLVVEAREEATLVVEALEEATLVVEAREVATLVVEAQEEATSGAGDRTARQEKMMMRKGTVMGQDPWGTGAEASMVEALVAPLVAA